LISVTHVPGLKCYLCARPFIGGRREKGIRPGFCRCHRHVEGLKSPLQPTDDNLTAGIALYRTHCQVCHGGADGGVSSIARGLTPNAPRLAKDGVEDDPEGVTYWKVAHGIRFTGMPAFGETLSGDGLPDRDDSDEIEHRMFCHITQNWRGQPLISHEVIINLIAHTTTKTGLKIRAALDRGRYPTGVAIAADELAAVNLKRADFHGEWNYAIYPTRKRT